MVFFRCRTKSVHNSKLCVYFHYEFVFTELGTNTRFSHEYSFIANKVF